MSMLRFGYMLDAVFWVCVVFNVHPGLMQRPAYITRRSWTSSVRPQLRGHLGHHPRGEDEHILLAGRSVSHVFGN